MLSGNPHYTLDPALAPIITANILEGLVRTAPESRAVFERQRQAFLEKLEPAMARWAQTLGLAKGAKVVVDHNLWLYFLTRYGLVLAGTVEERPGIPATPAHLVRLIAQMKGDGVKALILEPWGGPQARRAAGRRGGRHDRAAGPGRRGAAGDGPSALLDLPTGATVACMFGVTLVLWSGVARLRRRPVTVMEEST